MLSRANQLQKAEFDTALTATGLTPRKHQVLATRHLPPWRVILWVKLIEVLVQIRPKALWRTFFSPDPAFRHGIWARRNGGLAAG